MKKRMGSHLRLSMADPRIQGGVEETVVQNGWSLGMEQTWNTMERLESIGIIYRLMDWLNSWVMLDDPRFSSFI